LTFLPKPPGPVDITAGKPHGIESVKKIVNKLRSPHENLCALKDQPILAN